jgi:hypothetical protein
MQASAGHRPGHPEPRRVRLVVLGAFAVEVDGKSATPPPAVSRKARTVLKLLAVERGALVPIETVVEVLWPAAVPARPTENVATLVSRLRSWLGPSAVTGSQQGYRLGNEVEVDLVEATGLVTRAEQAKGVLVRHWSRPSRPDCCSPAARFSRTSRPPHGPNRLAATGCCCGAGPDWRTLWPLWRQGRPGRPRSPLRAASPTTRWTRR